MKVWVVAHAYVTTIAQEKLVALSRLPGLDLTALVPARWRTVLGEIPLSRGDRGYRVVPSRMFLNGRIGACFYRDGLRELRRARPDIVHAEVEPWSVAALQCALAAGEARLVIFTWENLDGPRRLASRMIERFVLRRASFVIAGNQAARARVMRRGVRPERIAVLPQIGVAPDRYASGDATPVRERFGLTPPVVGYIGRLVPEKGVETLIDAMGGLSDATLLIVGDGPARDGLERRGARSGDGRRVRFAGAVRHEEVPHYLACLDLLVLPSRTTPRWAEQFGHVLIEAMAAGVPVIGSSSGAIPEVIGDAGVIFTEEDHEALRCELGSLLSDEPLRKALAERGRERVRTFFTHEVIAREQHRIYARLLGR